MADYTNSLLFDAQTFMRENMTEAEFRHKVSPALELSIANKGGILNYEELKTSDRRALKAYVIDRTSRSTGSARGATHSGANGASSVVTPTWNSFTDKFKLSLKQGDRNVFTNAEMLAKQYLNAFINIHNDIGTAAQTFLSTNRTQVSISNPELAAWDDTNKMYYIDAADKEYYAQNVKSVMRQDHYTGTYDLIANPRKYAELERDANQGSGNATNYGFQFSGLNIAESTEISVPEIYKGLAYVMPTGVFSALPWIPKLNRQGHGAAGDNEGMYGTVIDPISGLTFAVHMYTEGADNEGTGSETQDVNYQVELSIDLGWVLPHLSTSNDSVVKAFAQGL